MYYVFPLFKALNSKLELSFREQLFEGVFVFAKRGPIFGGSGEEVLF